MKGKGKTKQVEESGLAKKTQATWGLEKTGEIDKEVQKVDLRVLEIDEDTPLNPPLVPVLHMEMGYFEHFQLFSTEFWSAAQQTKHRRIGEQGTKRPTRKAQFRGHEGTHCRRSQNPKECQERP